MTTSNPVILILGAGGNLGHAVAQTFLTKGYKVATSSRKPSPAQNSDILHIQSDFSNPSSVLETFNKVRYQLGIPSVVIYNAYGHHNVAQNDPLDLHLETFQQSLNANTTSTFLAAQQAVEGFRELPASMNKTFIYTGNMLNTTTMPSLLTLGLGKKATSYLIEASAIAYESDAFRFYYADEREADGTPMWKGVNGDAHAEQYLHLAETKTQEPWLQTFVKGSGYKSFSSA